ncbi:MAG TPA: retropepsin-like aspartic protease [Oculatellaceae cyanobacterium]|jgi:predicted aspartyl protease
MWKSAWHGGIAIFLSGSLGLVTAGCSNEDSASTASQSPTPAPATATNSAIARSKTATLVKSSALTGADNYFPALDKATAALTIAESASCPDDWLLVAAQWREAITLLKAVPAASRNHERATKMIAQYQQKLAYAQKQATIPPKPQVVATATINLPNTKSNSSFFSIPIARRESGVPVIEATFNGKHKFAMLLDTGASYTVITKAMAQKLAVTVVGSSRAKTGNGVTNLSVGMVKSLQVGGGVLKNLPVWIGQPDLEMGVVGQDFFSNYDMTIKQNVVEFQQRAQKSNSVS